MGVRPFRRDEAAPSVSLKRYRYTGKVNVTTRTGFTYHGARDLAALKLGRWTAGDPVGIADGVDLYVGVGGNPLMAIDGSGTNGEKIVDPER